MREFLSHRLEKYNHVMNEEEERLNDKKWKNIMRINRMGKSTKTIIKRLIRKA